MTDFYDLPEDLDGEVRERALADDAAVASCPYCGAEVEVLLDPGGAAVQEYVEDCEICCRPWTVHVQWVNGEAHIELATEDGV